jgi:hypothetical protein
LFSDALLRHESGTCQYIIRSDFFDIADRYLSSGQRGGLIIETGMSTGPVVGVECSAMIRITIA